MYFRLVTAKKAKFLCNIMCLIWQQDVKAFNLKKSFFGHFCKSEKLKWKPSLTWNFKETVEKQKTEK